MIVSYLLLCFVSDNHGVSIQQTTHCKCEAVYQCGSNAAEASRRSSV